MGDLSQDVFRGALYLALGGWAVILALWACSLVLRLGSAIRRRFGPEPRAMALLKRSLTPKQRAQLERRGVFEVIGSTSGKRYKIHPHPGGLQNIVALDAAGDESAILCLAPVGGLPIGDVMLAQKIALETDEPAALAVANSWPADMFCQCDGCRTLRRGRVR